MERAKMVSVPEQFETVPAETVPAVYDEFGNHDMMP